MTSVMHAAKEALSGVRVRVKIGAATLEIWGTEAPIRLA